MVFEPPAAFSSRFMHRSARLPGGSFPVPTKSRERARLWSAQILVALRLWLHGFPALEAVVLIPVAGGA